MRNYHKSSRFMLGCYRLSFEKGTHHAWTVRVYRTHEWYNIQWKVQTTTNSAEEAWKSRLCVKKQKRNLRTLEWTTNLTVWKRHVLSFVFSTLRRHGTGFLKRRHPKLRGWPILTSAWSCLVIAKQWFLINSEFELFLEFSLSLQLPHKVLQITQNVTQNSTTAHYTKLQTPTQPSSAHLNKYLWANLFTTRHVPHTYRSGTRAFARLKDHIV